MAQLGAKTTCSKRNTVHVGLDNR